MHKLDCPFTQCRLIAGVIYETAGHMALSFLIILIMRERKGEITQRRGKMFITYKSSHHR